MMGKIIWSAFGNLMLNKTCNKKNAVKKLIEIILNHLITSSGVLTINAFSFFRLLKSRVDKSLIVWGAW